MRASTPAYYNRLLSGTFCVHAASREKKGRALFESADDGHATFEMACGSRNHWLELNVGNVGTSGVFTEVQIIERAAMQQKVQLFNGSNGSATGSFRVCGGPKKKEDGLSAGTQVGNLIRSN